MIEWSTSGPTPVYCRWSRCNRAQIRLRSPAARGRRTIGSDGSRRLSPGQGVDQSPQFRYVRQIAQTRQTFSNVGFEFLENIKCASGHGWQWIDSDFSSSAFLSLDAELFPLWPVPGGNPGHQTGRDSARSCLVAHPRPSLSKLVRFQPDQGSHLGFVRRDRDVANWQQFPNHLGRSHQPMRIFAVTRMERKPVGTTQLLERFHGSRRFLDAWASASTTPMAARVARAPQRHFSPIRDPDPGSGNTTEHRRTSISFVPVIRTRMSAPGLWRWSRQRRLDGRCPTP
jgi:hypothetical protein